MHQIVDFVVEGFWDTHDIVVPVDRRVTFLIGQNGTGKTTLINLLAAALTADFRTLDRMAFKRISIRLTPSPEAERPTITVAKVKKKDHPIETIEYRINTGRQAAKDLVIPLADNEENALFRLAMRENGYRTHYRRLQSGIVAQLSDLVSVNWLSIHRSSPVDRPGEGRSYESSVDYKLESLSNDLVRYFATLAKQKDDEIRKFQESLFVSLLKQGNESKQIDRSRLDKIDDYISTLEAIFDELHVVSDTSSLLSTFKERAIKAKFDLARRRTIMTLNDGVFLAGLQRIEEIVQGWGKLQERLKSIFSHRDNFQRIADHLFQRKKMEITPSNEIQFISRSGKVLTPQLLSSGEKQLLILMSETLLQRQKPTIFIADEPELSLHVIWQERLIESLHSLNPNAQIIVATHSPDIVGPLVKKAINMEQLIK
jgi:predicted ATP-dependent endonuclease of OLD family